MRRTAFAPPDPDTSSKGAYIRRIRDAIIKARRLTPAGLYDFGVIPLDAVIGSAHVLFLFSPVCAMRQIFDYAYRLERDHASGTEIVVQHDSFTVVFGAYLACASCDTGHVYRVMHRARIMRASPQDAAVAAFAAMPKDYYCRPDTPSPNS